MAVVESVIVCLIVEVRHVVRSQSLRLFGEFAKLSSKVLTLLAGDLGSLEDKLTGVRTTLPVTYGRVRGHFGAERGEHFRNLVQFEPLILILVELVKNVAPWDKHHIAVQRERQLTPSQDIWM